MSNNISLSWQTSPCTSKARIHNAEAAGTGVGESFTTACGNCLGGHKSSYKSHVPPKSDNPEESPSAILHSSFLLEMLLQARNWTRHEGHGHEPLRPLVPKELVFLRAVLTALYVVTHLILAKAPGGPLTYPHFAEEKTEIQGSLSRVLKVVRLVSGRAALLAHFLHWMGSGPTSGLSGLRTKQPSGEYWECVSMNLEASRAHRPMAEPSSSTAQ